MSSINAKRYKELFRKADDETTSLTVVVPFLCKKPHYLIELLDDLQHINSYAWELILVDDGSDPSIFDALFPLLSRFRKCVYVRFDHNQGVSAARNLGIHLSSGRYVTFVDADDRVNFHLFPTVNKIIDTASGNDLICFSFQYFDGAPSFPLVKQDSFSTRNLPSKQGIRDYFYFNRDLDSYLMNSACGKLFLKSALIEHNLYFPEGLRHFEDAIFVRQCALFLENACIVFSAPIYFYRVNPLSASRSYQDGLAEKLQAYHDLHQALLPQFCDVLTCDTLAVLLIDILLNENKSPRKVTFRTVKKTLRLSFVNAELLRIPSIDLSDSVNLFLIRVQRLAKKWGRGLLALYVFLFVKKYLYGTGKMS